MGMYCCCGVKKTGDWKCECDQTGWHNAYKEPPKENGKYAVRILTDSADGYEDEIEFSVEPKFIYQSGWSDEILSSWDRSQTDDLVYQWKELP